jgi:hypothetical protein
VFYLSACDQCGIPSLLQVLEAYFMSLDNTYNKLKTLAEYIDDTEVRFGLLSIYASYLGTLKGTLSACLPVYLSDCCLSMRRIWVASWVHGLHVCRLSVCLSTCPTAVCPY